jgi:hypothetical protein
MITWPVHLLLPGVTKVLAEVSESFPKYVLKVAKSIPKRFRIDFRAIILKETLNIGKILSNSFQKVL